jgi:nucleotide-binding universal stress UspA family protein
MFGRTDLSGGRREALAERSNHMDAEGTEQRPRMDADPHGHRPPVVVGVDGSTHNQSAVDWAAAEAVRTHRDLRLVTTTGVFTQPVANVSAVGAPSFDYGDHYTNLLGRLASSVRERHPGLNVVPWVQSGDPVSALMGMSREGSVVVVGKRGLGAFERLLLGSTSIAVVGRAAGPVVVVPDSWADDGSSSLPVLVGIDLDHANDRALSFGFARADELGVQLIALHAWHPHPAAMRSSDDRGRWAIDAKRMVEKELSPLRERFPALDVHSSQIEGHPSEALLDAAARAQLLVLGRTSSEGRLTGLPIGSVTRAVLHYSEIPVAVVPSA